MNNFKWLEKRTVFCATWELHDIPIFVSLKVYWNTATLIQATMAELKSCDTHHDLKAWAITIETVSQIVDMSLA